MVFRLGDLVKILGLGVFLSLGIGLAYAQEDAESAALDMLRKHCSACHQADALVAREKPAGNFGNILNIKEIAKTSRLIKPGNPDGSRLFLEIANGRAPHHIFTSGEKDKPKLGVNEIKALRKWIAGLKPVNRDKNAGCEAREFISTEALLKAMRDDLNQLERVKRKTVRYITISHLYNACISARALDAYRVAIITLVNQQNLNPEAIKFPSIDEAQTIFRINLSDLGWSNRHWGRFNLAYPYASRYQGAVYAELVGLAGTRLISVRGDWLAANLPARMPRFHRLRRRDKRKPLGVDVAGFKEAMKKLDLDVNAKFNNVDVVTALAHRYDRPLNMRLAAAEFGLEAKDFPDKLVNIVSRFNKIRAQGRELKSRLEHGLIPRQKFDQFYANLARILTIDQTAAIARTPKFRRRSRKRVGTKAKFELTLYADKSIYTASDNPVFTVMSNRSCHLFLINIDQDGIATVMFPNKFQTKNALRAGAAFVFPSSNAPFRFRLKRLGFETMIAICNATRAGIDGIKHDFDKTALTKLGDYGDYIAHQITGRKPIKTVKRGRRPKGDFIARSAIKFEVK